MYYEDRERQNEIIVDNVIVYDAEQSKQEKKKSLNLEHGLTMM